PGGGADPGGGGGGPPRGGGAAGAPAPRMPGFAARPEGQEKLRLRAARDLLASAREDFRAGRYFDCLERCEQLTSAYPELAEGKEAAGLAAEIKANPERLAGVCDQMNQRTAAMYITLAESWAKKGQTAEAIACLEKVAKLCPNSRQADIAQGQLTKLRANGGTTPTGAIKP